jgi:tetratricopeptide (TPR) repeat protein
MQGMEQRLEASLREENEKQLGAFRKILAGPADDRARAAAESGIKAVEVRASRAGDDAAQIARSATAPDATDINRELTRILEKEGADAALAYGAAQKPAILSNTAATSRSALAPLLTMAKLQQTKGQDVAARASYRELLGLDPKWPDLLEAFAWFLRDQSDQSRRHGSLREAVADAEEARTLATRLIEVAPGYPKSERLLTAALDALGDVLMLRRQEGDVEKAFGHYTNSLAIAESLRAANPGSAEAARDVSISMNKIGDFLVKRGQVGDGEKALGYYTNGLAIAESLRAANPRSAEAARDVSISMNKIGDFLVKRGQVGDGEKAFGYYTNGLAIREVLRLANPGSAAFARDVVVSHYKLAIFAEMHGEAVGEEKHSRANFELLKGCIRQGMTFDPPIMSIYETLKVRFGGK